MRSVPWVYQLLVVAKDLWKIYRNGVTALRGVSFELRDSRLIILAGPNGAGKTTLVRILDGELSPTRGYVEIAGMDPERARLRGLLGVMPQEAQLHEYLSVKEYLYYLALIKGLSRSDARREVVKLIEDFMLHEYADTRIEHLSGGFKRRVLLAQAFIGNPQLVILDEPTVGLDPEMRVRLWDIILKYLHEYDAMALLVTHYLDEVREYVDRVLLLHRGALIFDGSPGELLDILGYRYRVRIKLANSNIANKLPVRRYVQNRTEIEAFVCDDSELISLVKFVETHRGSIQEYIIERPSLEESYIEIVRKHRDRDRGVA